MIGTKDSGVTDNTGELAVSILVQVFTTEWSETSSHTSPKGSVE